MDGKIRYYIDSIKNYINNSLSFPLMVMYFIMLLTNTLLRDTKDTMLVNSQAGVEAIPILKSWAVIPCSVLFFIIYSRLAHILSKRALFLSIVYFFVAFYVLFAILIFPFKHQMTPLQLGSRLRQSLPINLHPLVAVIEEWALGLFYVVSELWASAVCQLLFWQVANDVMTIHRAKSSYPIIGAMGNLGMVFAGQLLRIFADRRDVIQAQAYLRISNKQIQERIQRKRAEQQRLFEKQQMERERLRLIEIQRQQLYDELMKQRKKEKNITPNHRNKPYKHRRTDSDSKRFRNLAHKYYSTFAPEEIKVSDQTMKDLRRGLDEEKTPSLSFESGLMDINSSEINDINLKKYNLNGQQSYFPTLPSFGEFPTNFHPIFQGVSEDPLDAGWMATHFGISVVMLTGAVIITLCYNSVYRRKHSSHHSHGHHENEKHHDHEHHSSKKNHSAHHHHHHHHHPHQVVHEETRLEANGDTNEGSSLLKTRARLGSGVKKIETNSESTSIDIAPSSHQNDEKQYYQSQKPSKPKLTLWESLRMLSHSIPLRCAAVLVSSYGLTIALVEVSWKGQVKHAFVDQNDYARFMGSFWTWTGLISMIFMLLGRTILLNIGYRAAVLFTPVLMGISGTLFFIMVELTGRQVADAKQTGGPIQPIQIAAYIGGLAVLISKASKYAFFDSTKEILFIPLDRESQSVGKAAIDVVAYRLSKSGGSLFLQGVIFIFGSVVEGGVLPISILFFIVVSLWLWAALVTGKLMHQAQIAERKHSDIVVTGNKDENEPPPNI